MKRKNLRSLQQNIKKIKQNESAPSIETGISSSPAAAPTPTSAPTPTPPSRSLPPPPDLMKISNPDHWAHVQSKLYKTNFKWTIDNFSFRPEKTSDCLESPKFSVDIHNEIKWNLQLYPKGQGEENKDYLSIYLQRVTEPCNKTKVLGKFKIYILNVEPDKTFGSYSSIADEFEGEQRLGCPKFIERAILLDESNGFLPDDKLTIFCEVSFVYDYTEVSSPTSIGQFKIPEYKVIDGWADLLFNQNLSDVELTVGLSIFPAHKTILGTQSDFFAALFNFGMDGESGKLEITDVSAEVLEELVRFIYTGKTLKLKEMARELLVAADIYSIQTLKAMCEKQIFTDMSIKTAADVLILASSHSADQLKTKTIQYINIHAKDIIKTKGWQKMVSSNEHSSLIAEILEAFVMKQHSPTP